MTSTTERSPGAAPEPPPGLVRFNALPAGEAAAAVDAVCTCTTWGHFMLTRRPYPTIGHLLAANDAAMAELTEADLRQAMCGHAPIGSPEQGDAVSVREQRGMAGAPPQLTRQVRELNRRYRDTFGHVFLICASGLTAEQMRDALKERLHNQPEQEREIVRTELTKINRIRLTHLANRLPTHLADDPEDTKEPPARNDPEVTEKAARSHRDKPEERRESNG